MNLDNLGYDDLVVRLCECANAVVERGIAGSWRDKANVVKEIAVDFPMLDEFLSWFGGSLDYTEPE